MYLGPPGLPLDRKAVTDQTYHSFAFGCSPLISNLAPSMQAPGLDCRPVEAAARDGLCRLQGPAKSTGPRTVPGVQSVSRWPSRSLTVSSAIRCACDPSLLRTRRLSPAADPYFSLSLDTGCNRTGGPLVPGPLSPRLPLLRTNAPLGTMFPSAAGNGGYCIKRAYR